MISIVRKLWAPAVIVLLVLLYGGQCRSLGRGEAEREQERIAHAKETAEIAQQLALARAKRDTVLRTVRVQQVQLVHDSIRVIVADSVVHQADSLGDSLTMIRSRDTAIATRDTLIGKQRTHIATLLELAASDSGLIHLYQDLRAKDSTYIKKLELRQRGFRILGLQLPRLKCVVGPVVLVYPRQELGLGAACGLTF